VNDTRCTIEEIETAIENVLYVDHVDYGTDEDAEVLGLVRKLTIGLGNNFLRLDMFLCNLAGLVGGYYSRLKPI
jgi:hypothetical protein